MGQNTILHNVRIACYKRDNHACQKCGNRDWRGRVMTLHHAFPKDLYRWADGDEEWNLFTLCESPCHVGVNGVQENQTEMEKFQKIAYARRPKNRPQHIMFLPFMSSEERIAFNKEKRICLKPELRKRDTKENTRRREEYRANVERFKERHGGLTPMQVSYQRQKGLKNELDSATL